MEAIVFNALRGESRMKLETEKYIELAKILKEEGLDNEVIAAIIKETAKDHRMEIIREDKMQKQEEWKKEPATELQKELISKLDGEYKPLITKGEASNLITELKSKKK